MKPLNENSSITYNNVNNITYQGTQAQGGTFIYNNVANIQKEAVELRNSYSSESSGFGVGVSAGIGSNGQIKPNGISGNVSANRSDQNTVETVYANGNFKNVNEVHNNTGSMILSGFNQEGGKVKGNIGKLVVESRQNTSTTTGSSRGIGLGISANGMPSSVNVSGSRTNGNRAFVDNQSSFIIGEGSNLHIGTLENTGAVIGKQSDNSTTFKIDNYIAKNIYNEDTMTTTGGSIGASLGGKPRITSAGFNQDSRDKEGITRNTIVGNVEIGHSSGDEINRDLGKANEIIREKYSSINVNLEPQLIEAITNSKEFKNQIDMIIAEVKENFKDKNINIVALPNETNKDIKISNEYISYTGENKIEYGRTTNGEIIYAEDISKIINKVEDVEKGKIKEEDVFVVIDGMKYFVYVADAHYAGINEANKYSTLIQNNYEYGGIVYRVEKENTRGYYYTPAARGNLKNVNLLPKYYIEPLKEKLAKKGIKVTEVGGYHTHKAAFEQQLSANKPDLMGAERANYFSDSNSNGAGASDLNYAFYNGAISVGTPGVITGKKRLHPSEGWLYTSIGNGERKGKLQYLGIIDSYEFFNNFKTEEEIKNYQKNSHFHTMGGTTYIPTIIYTDQHDIELVKSMYEKVTKDNDEADKKDREEKDKGKMLYKEIMKKWEEKE